MSRRARLLVGLVLLFGVAPMAALLWPTEDAPVREASCGLGALASGLSFSFDFTGIFIGVGIAFVGLAFVIASLFRRMPTFKEPEHRDLRLVVGLVLALVIAPGVVTLGWFAGMLGTTWLVQAGVLAIVGVALCASAASNDAQAELGRDA